MRKASVSAEIEADFRAAGWSEEGAIFAKGEATGSTDLPVLEEATRSAGEVGDIDFQGRKRHGISVPSGGEKGRAIGDQRARGNFQASEAGDGSAGDFYGVGVLGGEGSEALGGSGDAGIGAPEEGEAEGARWSAADEIGVETGAESVDSREGGEDARGVGVRLDPLGAVVEVKPMGGAVGVNPPFGGVDRRALGDEFEEADAEGAFDVEGIRPGFTPSVSDPDLAIGIDHQGEAVAVSLTNDQFAGAVAAKIVDQRPPIILILISENELGTLVAVGVGVAHVNGCQAGTCHAGVDSKGGL